MSSCAYVTFDEFHGPRLEGWRVDVAAELGLSYDAAVVGGVWVDTARRDAGATPPFEVWVKTRDDHYGTTEGAAGAEISRITVSTTREGDLPAVASLGLRVWLRLGGSLEVSEEVRPYLAPQPIDPDETNRFYALVHPGGVRGSVSERPLFRRQDAEARALDGYAVVFFPRLDRPGPAQIWRMNLETFSQTPEAAISKFTDALHRSVGWDAHHDAGYRVRRVRLVDLGDAETGNTLGLDPPADPR